MQKKNERDIKKPIGIRMNDDTKEIANNLIVVRANRRFEKAETFTSLIENLILEAWRREKYLILKEKELSKSNNSLEK